MTSRLRAFDWRLYVIYLVFAAINGTSRLFAIDGATGFVYKDLVGAAAIGVLSGVGARGCGNCGIQLGPLRIRCRDSRTMACSRCRRRLPRHLPKGGSRR